MDGNKIRDLLLATVATKTSTGAAVQRASGWALFTGCDTLVCFALAIAVTYALGDQHVCCSKAAEASALWLGIPCCAVLQAATAALALQLPCRRPCVRRALAYLAPALTFVGHCKYDLFARISCTMNIVIVAMFDHLCFLYCKMTEPW